MTSTPITGLVASSPAAWPSSGRHIVIPFGRVLRVFDIASSAPTCIATLQGHSAAVVSVVPAGNMRVASASEDGTVRVWDISDGSCLQTIDVGQQISAMCEAGPEKLVCLGARGISLVSLSKQQKSRIRNLFASNSIESTLGRVAAPADGTFIAMVHTNFLHVRSTAKGEECRAVLVKHYSWLTSVTVSSDGSMLAVGDEAGAIFVYPNPTLMLPKSSKPIKLEQSKASSSRLHWHSSPVRGLAFSQDGNVLVSGGAEAVLVTWKMTRNHFGSRSFLPRLRASILGISISNDESSYALTQADNSVRLINQASNTITSTIRGISANIMDFQPFIHQGSLSSRISPGRKEVMGITRDPREKGHVLISGSGGEIQLFDLYKGQHVSDIVVIPKNVINEPKRHLKHAKCPEPPLVTHVEMDRSGEHLVTVDQQSLARRKNEDFDIEATVTTLRFWKTKRNSKMPSLASVFRQPHGVGVPVSSVCIHPHIPVVVTTSCDGKFKLWREVKGVKKGQQVIWRSEAQFGYKGQPCTSACFSDDGSLLAVSCGSVLTMWHIEDVMARAPHETPVDQDGDKRPELDAPSSLRVELLHALVHPPAEETIQSVSFVHRRFPLFITVTEAGIYVWNALTQGIWWSSRIRTHPTTIAADEKSGCFALVVKIPSLGRVADDSHNDIRSTIQEPHTENENLKQADGLYNGIAECANGDAAKGLHGRSITRKGGEKLAKRGRSKRKHQAVGKPESKPEGRPSRTCPMDSAIAFFDAASPYPLRISRLPTGVDVTSLEFMQNSLEDKGTQAPLACVNSDLDVSFYNATGSDDDKLSLLTAPQSPGGLVDLPSSKPIGKLESLLGSSQHRDGEDWVKTNSNLHEKAEVAITISTSQLSPRMQGQENSQASLMRACDDYFDGPVHIQAPVSSKSFDFINTILRQSRGTAVDESENRNNVEMQSAGLMENPLDVKDVKTSVDAVNRNPELLAEEHTARSDFFRELVRSRDKKNKKAKARER